MAPSFFQNVLVLFVIFFGQVVKGEMSVNVIAPIGRESNMMDQRMWSGRTLLKYTLIQLPEIGVFVLIVILVRQWVVFSSWLMWGLIGVWVAKDVLLYPFVWRAYEWRTGKEENSMIGLRGIAKDRLNPSGFIFVRGELWKARVIDDGVVIEKGESVLVKGTRGLTLMVDKENSPNCG